MLKKIVLLGTTLSSLTIITAIGCSSSSSGATGADSGVGDTDSGKRDSGKSSSRDGGGTLSGKDGGGIAHFDGGGSDGGPITLSDGGVVSAPACYDLANAGVLTMVTAPAAHQNLCNGTQISGYATACLPGTATDCDNFIAANGPCSTCLGGAASGTFPFPAVIPIDSAGDAVPNAAGCYAALSTGDATCKLNFNSDQECEQSACNSCATDVDNSDCLNYADADPGGCAPAYPTDGTCLDAVNVSAGNVANQTACGFGAPDFNTGYTAVATTLCGP